MILDNSLKLEMVLAGNVTNNQLPVHVDYFTWNTEGKKTKPIPFRTVSNQTTDVTILAAPTTQGEVREPIEIVVYNRDTVAATVTIKTDDGTTERIAVKKTLQAGESLIGYRMGDDGGMAWMVF